MALTVGQRGQELLHAGGEMLGHESVVDPVGPRLRRCGPCPGTVEPILDDAVVGATRSLLAAGRRPGPVQQYAKQPRLEGGAAFEPLDAAQHREPGVLGDLFGDGAAPNRRFRQAQHAWLVEADERDECRLVTRPEAVDQIDLVVHASRS